MNTNISVRKIGTEHMTEALSLVRRVFAEYEAPDYTKEGAEEFYKSIDDPNFIAELCMFGAFERDKLVGVIAVRDQTHIALFFVDGEYQRSGIGKQLFRTVTEICPSDKITVNSSPYAVPIYHKLGFSDTDTEQSVNGLRFTPMELRR